MSEPAAVRALRPGDRLRLTVERVATGGRMIGRHDGAIVLVAGAIPGEVVTARVERVQRGTIWARTVEVLEASSDRVACSPALACGGHVLAHVRDARQHALKGEMLVDAFRRLGRLAIEGTVPVLAASPEGYRTRARVHVRSGRGGFFDEGSHRLCDVAGSQQLSDASAEVVERLVAALAASSPGADAEIEWVEDVGGQARIAHVDSALAVARPDDAWRVEGLDGLAWTRPATAGGSGAWGLRRVRDTVSVSGAAAPVAIAHQARAFFQGNRYLLQPLVDEVLGRIAGPAVCDLYAGVGLFALAAAAAGCTVDAVEGHIDAAADLEANALALGVTCHRASVEAFLAQSRPVADTVIVDPPRTGMSADALAGLLAWRPSRVVYVSCDPATLARDCRRLVDGGYVLGALRGVDLFPRTGHVEAVVTLARSAGA